MPRPLPPNAEALRAQAAAPAPATEPETNPVELAFELAGEISDSLQMIALALSGLFTIEAARIRREIPADEMESTGLGFTLATTADALAAIGGDDAPVPSDASAAGTDPA